MTVSSSGYVAITGGIGSGKSYVCRQLSAFGIEVYDCDAAAKRLMRTDRTLRSQLESLIGTEAYGPDADDGTFTLRKDVVAKFLLASDGNRQAIDSIVHPAVARDFVSSGYQWLESAILFQAQFDKRVKFRTIIAVTAPRAVRIERVVRRDGISTERAEQWLDRQWPQEEIERRADFVIVNDGIQPLMPQIETIINLINHPGD